MKYIAVFCSANDLDQKYTKSAGEVALLMVKNGFNLVWGGTDKGLMKIIATGVQKGGGKIIGISMEILKDLVRKNADEMIIAKNLGEGKALMLERCDAVLVLVGGIGTLDELTEIVELKKHNLHDKPVVVLNTQNFYEGLKIQLKKMKEEGFINQSLDKLIYFANRPEEALEFIQVKLANIA